MKDNMMDFLNDGTDYFSEDIPKIRNLAEGRLDGIADYAIAVIWERISMDYYFAGWMSVSMNKEDHMFKLFMESVLK